MKTPAQILSVIRAHKISQVTICDLYSKSKVAKVANLAKAEKRLEKADIVDPSSHSRQHQFPRTLRSTAGDQVSPKKAQTLEPFNRK